MASINKVILIGRLGKDPQISLFQNGGKIANFTLATSDVWKDKQTGEKKEHTEWHNITVTSPALTDLAERYLQKGNQVYIEGKLQTRKWTDKNGIERYVTEIILAPYSGQIMLLENKPSNAVPTNTSDWANQIPTIPANTYADMDDDIPF